MTAVELQFADVLAGLAVWRRKPQRQRLVDHLPACRLARADQRRLARLRHASSELLERHAGLRTGNAHHRNRSRRPTRGQRKYGGTIGHGAGLASVEVGASRDAGYLLRCVHGTAAVNAAVNAIADRITGPARPGPQSSRRRDQSLSPTAPG